MEQVHQELMTVSAFKTRFCISNTEFYRQVNTGKLRITKMGRSTRVTAADAQAWVNALPTKGGQA